MDPRKLLIHLESPYANYDASLVPVHDVLVAGLSWETEYWSGLAVQWLEQGAEVDAEIAVLLDNVAARKHFPQSLRHKAFAMARRWSRQATPNTSLERTRER
jgi:hypothetical protein